MDSLLLKFLFFENLLHVLNMNILKTAKGLQIAKAILSKRNTCGIISPNFKIYYINATHTKTDT